jgi:N-acetylmuramic acid 6-phosphate (MurNAc-6-P) etherase
MAGDGDCPLHSLMQQKLAEIEKAQRARQCQGHEERIKGMERAEERLTKASDVQWTAINDLRKLVYMGAGGAALLSFLGAVLGAFLRRF